MEEFLENLKKGLEEKRQTLQEKENELKSLENDEEGLENNKDGIDKLKEEIKMLKKSVRYDERFIKTLAGTKERKHHLKEIEEKLPYEIISSMPYRNYMNGYIAQQNLINVSNIKLLEDGEVYFKLGLEPEVNEGKAIMKLVEDSIYNYCETRGYEENEDGIKQELNRISISVSKMNTFKQSKGNNFEITAILHEGQWLMNRREYLKKPKDKELAQWEKVEDISKFPMEEILSIESLDEDMKQFFMENFTPIFEKEQEEKTLTELLEELDDLTEKEEQAKELLEQYENQLYNGEKEI